MIYLFPIIAAIIGFVFFKIAIQIFLSKNSNSKWALISFIKHEKNKAALQLSEYVQKEFFNEEKLKSMMSNPALFQKIKPEVEKHVDVFLKEKLLKKWPMISMLGGDEMIATIHQTLMQELEVIIPSLLSNYADGLLEKLQIDQMIQQKLDSFSDMQIYDILISRIWKISKMIPMLGAAAGFLTGMILLLLSLIGG